jgi:Rieske Fe-S protein
VRTAAGPEVACSALVVATNTPVNDRFAIHTKQAPYLTYAVAAAVPRGWVTKGLYWDTLDPYHYVRLQKLETAESGEGGVALDPSREELVIVGGEDHKTGQASDHEERYRRLEAWARERLPRMGPVAYRWSGQVMETIDGVAFIGRNPADADNVYIATGDSGMGMTHGTIAGLLLTDLILGRDNPWAKLYDPSRKTLRAAGEFVKENLNVAVQYKDWLTGGDKKSAAEIPAGSGAVVGWGIGKAAVYRDDSGALHTFSAVCPHLGCVVSWNGPEKTWDCPCHGSRFACTGEVVVGPANRGLEPVKKTRRNNIWWDLVLSQRDQASRSWVSTCPKQTDISSVVFLLAKPPHPFLDQLHRLARAVTADRLEVPAFHLVVRNEEMLELLEAPLANVGEGMKLRRIERSFECGDEPVVAGRFPFLGLVGLDHPDQAGRHNTAGKGRLVHEQQNVERVAVLAAGQGEEAEVERETGPQRQHLVKSEAV